MCHLFGIVFGWGLRPGRLRRPLHQRRLQPLRLTARPGQPEAFAAWHGKKPTNWIGHLRLLQNEIKATAWDVQGGGVSAWIADSAVNKANLWISSQRGTQAPEVCATRIGFASLARGDGQEMADGADGRGKEKC